MKRHFLMVFSVLYRVSGEKYHYGISFFSVSSVAEIVQGYVLPPTESFQMGYDSTRGQKMDVFSFSKSIIKSRDNRSK